MQQAQETHRRDIARYSDRGVQSAEALGGGAPGTKRSFSSSTNPIRQPSLSSPGYTSPPARPASLCTSPTMSVLPSTDIGSLTPAERGALLQKHIKHMQKDESYVPKFSRFYSVAAETGWNFDREHAVRILKYHSFPQNALALGFQPCYADKGNLVMKKLDAGGSAGSSGRGFTASAGGGGSGEAGGGSGGGGGSSGGSDDRAGGTCGGGKPGTCFVCSQTGHWARECPSKFGGSRGVDLGACFRCGGEGHWAGDCPGNEEAGIAAAKPRIPYGTSANFTPLNATKAAAAARLRREYAAAAAERSKAAAAAEKNGL